MTEGHNSTVSEDQTSWNTLQEGRSDEQYSNEITDHKERCTSSSETVSFGYSPCDSFGSSTVMDYQSAQIITEATKSHVQSLKIGVCIPSLAAQSPSRKERQSTRAFKQSSTKKMFWKIFACFCGNLDDPYYEIDDEQWVDNALLRA